MSVFSNRANYRRDYHADMVLLGSSAPKSVIKDLSRIPGIGPSLASDLCSLGIHQVGELRGRDPERLYSELCERAGQHVDRCVLYAFRCAVYFASESRPDPEKLKWWNWKNSGWSDSSARVP